MKIKLLIAFILFASPYLLFSQDKREIDSTTLADVIVYANKFPEPTKYIAQSISTIKNTATLNLQANSADALSSSGAVFIQKSQQGGGSPIIRGFEASRVLLMVDGIRMNNAIYRAGHLQNIITVDNMALNRMEILYGPSSTLYGSDALGGVINMYTINPALSATNKILISGSATLRYATAIDEQRANIILNTGGKQWASLTVVTYGSFGDVIQGKQRNSQYPDFGLKSFFVTRNGNADTALSNPNPYKQISSGYNQIDVTQKFLYQPNENIQHILNLQFSNSGNIPRYDRLTEISNSNPVFAEWYYGPQKRNLVAYHFNATKLNGFFQEIKAVTSYQDIAESRITRKFKNDNKDSRRENVTVFGLNVDAKHCRKKNELHVGAESYNNFVKSISQRQNIITSSLSKITTRYADGPTKMNSNALYAQHTLHLNNNWTLNDGLRITLTKLDAIFADTSLMHFPFTNAKQNNVATTGNLGIIYHSPTNLKLAAVVSSGFRVPNVDDLSKVFESATGKLIVPNPNLKPEYTYNSEINFTKSGKKYNFGGSIFYNLFRNALVVDKFTFNGQPTILYNGAQSDVVAVQNKAKAYLYGFSVNAATTFAKNTTVEAVATYTYGRYKNETNKVPLDHIPPVYGRLGITHQQKIWSAEWFVLFNGWKKIKDFSTNGEDNEQYATQDGMPSWATLNLRGTINIGKNLVAQILVENILDYNYRYFASGISAPGRNFIINLKTNF